jgi:hypothetical protein
MDDEQMIMLLRQIADKEREIAALMTSEAFAALPADRQAHYTARYDELVVSRNLDLLRIEEMTDEMTDKIRAFLARLELYDGE